MSKSRSKKKKGSGSKRMCIEIDERTMQGKGNDGWENDARKPLVVFTDGSCTGNGTSRPAGGMGIHFPNGEMHDICKIFRLDNCTSQRTELGAILLALRKIKAKLDMSKYKIMVRTDSLYSVNCFTKWVAGWIKNGWVKQDGNPVQNKDLLEPIYRYVKKYRIRFRFVKAHTGGRDPDSRANAQADHLATHASKKARGKKSFRQYSDEAPSESVQITLDNKDKSGKSRSKRVRKKPGYSRTGRKIPPKRTESKSADSSIVPPLKLSSRKNLPFNPKGPVDNIIVELVKTPK